MTNLWNSSKHFNLFWKNSIHVSVQELPALTLDSAGVTSCITEPKEVLRRHRADCAKDFDQRRRELGGSIGQLKRLTKLTDVDGSQGALNTNQHPPKHALAHVNEPNKGHLVVACCLRKNKHLRHHGINRIARYVQQRPRIYYITGRS
jgi:hypothetical protein